MTGNLVLDLVISLAGVAVLVGVAALLGATRTMTLDRASAAERLAFDEPDFVAAEWILSADGRSAFALSADGREGAAVFVLGDSLGTRRFAVGRHAVRADGSRLILSTGDVTMRRVAVVAPDAAESARWAGLLGGEALSSAHGIS